MVPHLDDNTQLSVERYRGRLYAAIADKRERMRRRVERREGSDSDREPDIATPIPSETTPTSKQSKSPDPVLTDTKKVHVHVM